MKLDPNVYIQAAELIADGIYVFSCSALATIPAKDLSCYCEQNSAYADYFEPCEAIGQDCHFEFEWWNGAKTKENQDARATALCLMAAIVESCDL